ncbi:hypothetical protein C0J45_24391, partial [Silurus meridionalis]
MILLSISIFWLSVCVDPISADPPITVKAHVGSTALLPCDLSKVFNKMIVFNNTVVWWYSNKKLVFERSFNSTSSGKEYEGRVDVPKDELLKGNCSLVLKNTSINDDSNYTTYVMELLDSTEHNKPLEIIRVKLSY